MEMTAVIVGAFFVVLWCALIVTVGVGYLLHKAAAGLSRDIGLGAKAQVVDFSDNSHLMDPQTHRNDPFDPGPVPGEAAQEPRESPEARSTARVKGQVPPPGAWNARERRFQPSKCSFCARVRSIFRGRRRHAEGL